MSPQIHVELWHTNLTGPLNYPTEMYLTTPSVIVIGGGAFGRKRERDEVKGRTFMNGISALVRVVSQLAYFPSLLATMGGYKSAAYNPEPSPEPDHAGLPISDFQPPELWQVHLWCL